MHQLYKNIKRVREDKNMSQTQLAELTGYTHRSSITKIEKGEVDLSLSKIELFAKVFDTTPEDLVGWEECDTIQPKSPPQYPPQLNTIMAKAQQLNSKGLEELEKHTDLLLLKEDYRKNVEFAQELSIPSRIIQYFQSVSAGTGQVIFDDVYFERITIPDIPEYRRVAYAVKVSGYSMEPLYSDGDMLLIEPTCSIDVGEIGIFNVNGQAYVKKLGEGELISLNAEYRNVTLTDDSRCMGRVVDKFTNKHD